MSSIKSRCYYKIQKSLLVNFKDLEGGFTLNKFFDILQNTLAPMAVKLDANRYLKAIRTGFLTSMPLLIIGSMFLLITQLPFQPYLNFMASILGPEWQNYFLQVNNMAISIMSIFVIIGLSRELANYYKISPVPAQAAAIYAFLILTPTLTDKAGVTSLPIANFGASGLFVAMIAAVLAVEIFRLVHQRGWIIKMPESVPPNISVSFSALIPVMFVAIVFNVIRILFTFTTYETAHNFILQFLQKPLLILGSSIWALLLILLFEALLWSFGIHGSSIVRSVMDPVWTALALANLEAFQNNEVLPNIINLQFYTSFIKLGGSGATIGLAISCLLFTKSTQFKTLGRLAIGPSIFNINEPLTFGVPIVLNPVMLIPFIITPLILSLISYFVMSIGLVPLTNGIQIPWTMPTIISGFILAGWRGAVLQLFLILTSVAIYFPFFRIEDNRAYEIEKQGTSQT